MKWSLKLVCCVRARQLRRIWELHCPPVSHLPSHRAHPDLNQGPADLRSAALTTELCTQDIVKRFWNKHITSKNKKCKKKKQKNKNHNWPRGVTASTLDPESSDRGSNPREAFSHGAIFRGPLAGLSARRCFTKCPTDSCSELSSKSSGLKGMRWQCFQK